MADDPRRVHRPRQHRPCHRRTGRRAHRRDEERRRATRVDRLDVRTLSQAYAQAKHVDRVSGLPAAPLLVFSRAFLDRPISRRRGVTVLPARLLAEHLSRRPVQLSPTEIAAAHQRLISALA